MKVAKETIRSGVGHSFRVYRWSKTIADIEVILSLGQFERARGFGCAWHYHPETELVWIRTGKGIGHAGDCTYPFVDGDVLLLGAELPHYRRESGRSSGIGVQFKFEENHPIFSFPESEALAHLFRQASRGLRFSGSTARAIGSCLTELADASGFNRVIALLRALSILAAAPKGETHVLSRRSFSDSADERRQEPVREVMRFIGANFREPIHLKEALELTGLPRRTFAKYFKEFLGKSFRTFLTETRLHAAASTLVQSERPIVDVALSCGFTQVTAFNRLFRKEYGCAPSVFRRRKRRDP